GSPVFFRGEWEGKSYEDKGTVLQYQPEKMLRYDYFSSWSDLEDRPEHYQIITSRVKPKGNSTVITLLQQNIDTLEKKVHSVQTWGALLDDLKKLMENR
ncbi:MAG: SRPBCC domain-containing protein, partial [Saprospiraceae bacterium]|nr:SRPBCC domain-containing protein [Saprospiraceae bacterium]